jgi:hypothetical protein
MMKREEGRDLIISAVAEVVARNRKALQTLLSAMAAADPELAARLRQAGLIG